REFRSRLVPQFGQVPNPLPRARGLYTYPQEAADLAALGQFASTLPPGPIFDFSGERALYYLLDRRPAVRCPDIAILSAPRLTTEALQQLEKTPPVFVIVDGLPVLGSLDGVPNRDRVPAIAAWVDAHYPARQQIGRYTVALPRCARARGRRQLRVARHRRMLEDARGHCDHRAHIADGRRHDHRGPALGQQSELLDVLLGEAKLHRLAAARRVDGLRDLHDSLGGRLRHRHDRRCLPLRLVDGLLLLRFRGLDHLLPVALGAVDRGVALPFRLQDQRALLALGAHLLLHRGEHVLRRRDVLDLVAQHLHAPRFRGLVDF